jgi:methylmalonyl-CoA mutase
MANSNNSLPFDSMSDAQWKLLVEKELKGKSFDDFLVWNSLDGFSIEAWQSALPSPLPNLAPLNEAWKIIEPIYESDAQKANATALSALNHGAEGIWFKKGFLGAAANVASHQIDQGIAPVFIENGNVTDVYRSLLKTGSEEEISVSDTLLLDGQRIRERGGSTIDELVVLISQGLEASRKFGFDSNLLFKTAAGSGFLTEVAKIRALRWLWSQILVHEKQSKQPYPTIIVVNLSNGYTQNDEHTNILRATSSALSAITGGAQFIMIEPWDQSWKDSNAFSTRITRNIQTLLKNEARMDKNLNPADGSFFLENLTVAMAKNAWARVQIIEKAGGFSSYAKSGALKSDLEFSRTKLVSAYQAKQKTLLGANKYQAANPIQESVPNKSTYTLLPEYLHLPSNLQLQKA